MMRNDLVRIVVFYDGDFLFHVSNYYLYHHEKKSRISIGGMHSFIRSQVSTELGVDEKFCQIAASHYFRGRIPAPETNKDAVFKERLFEDVLVREGVITHYLPASQNDRSIDVLFALEVYEAATQQNVDVIVLVASDGDLVPLVRKISCAGKPVMLVGCDFEFDDENGSRRVTRTSSKLLEEVSFPVMLNEAIDESEEVVESLFVPKREGTFKHRGKSFSQEVKPGKFSGTVENVLNGFGFIIPDPGNSPVLPGQNIFFHFNDVEDGEDLRTGDKVIFEMGKNDRGVCAKMVKSEE